MICDPCYDDDHNNCIGDHYDIVEEEYDWSCQCDICYGEIDEE